MTLIVLTAAFLSGLAICALLLGIVVLIDRRYGKPPVRRITDGALTPSRDPIGPPPIARVVPFREDS